jgi:hypothetical protein
MMTKHLAGAALALALGGCGLFRHEEKLAPQPGADQVSLTKEQDGKFLAFVGPRLLHAAPFLGVDDTNYFALRSWLDTRTGETAHQLYVEDSYYGSPYRWDGAQETDRGDLRFIPISRNEITCELGCSYADEFAAVLPEDLLRARRDSGLSVTFTSQTGRTLTVNVPPHFIAEELSAVDTTRAALASNALQAQQAAPVPVLPPGTVVPAPTPEAMAPPAPSDP